MINRFLTIGKGFLKNIGLIIFDTFLKPFLTCRNPQPLLLGVVRLDDIGDFILWLDGAKHIREFYSTHRIILIANSSWASFARRLPFWDEVYDINVAKFKRNIFYRWQTFRQIRNFNIETIIHPTHICHLIAGDSVTRFSNAKNRIGSEGDTSSSKNGWQKRIANRWYNQLIKASPKPLTVLERNIEFINHLTNGNQESKTFSLAKTDVPMDHLMPTEKYFLIFPGSNGAYKIWPKESFATLVKNLVATTGYKAIICGAALEMDICNWIATASELAISIAGKTSLTEVVELIRKAEFVIGNDSGSIHIAAATNTQSFCIIGGGHFGLFLPYPDNWMGKRPYIINHNMPCYGCGWRCHFVSSATSNPYPCISNISVESVTAHITNELKKTR
jgi:ADP-heptose:LPS heptosyltransferase